jgi:hypothetical protein
MYRYRSENTAGAEDAVYSHYHNSYMTLPRAVFVTITAIDRWLLLKKNFWRAQVELDASAKTLPDHPIAHIVRLVRDTHHLRPDLRSKQQRD